MAIAYSSLGPEVILDALRTNFQHMRDRLHVFFARRRAFQTTYHDLSALSDRTLSDLGFARRDIRRLARDAAFAQ